MGGKVSRKQVFCLIETGSKDKHWFSVKIPHVFQMGDKNRTAGKQPKMILLKRIPDVWQLYELNTENDFVFNYSKIFVIYSLPKSLSFPMYPFRGLVVFSHS